MEDFSASSPQDVSSDFVEPLLFQRREYLDAIEADATDTSCQKTRNPADYGPDD